MTTTTTPQERLALYEAQIPMAQAELDGAVAALLAVGSEVTHDLRVLGEEVTDEVLTLTLDNVEHLAQLAEVARRARDTLADAVFSADAQRQEIEDLRRYWAGAPCFTGDEPRPAGERM